MELETIIIKNLIYNEKYSRKVLPFLKEEYFGEASYKILFNQIEEYILKYNSNPTYEALIVIFNKKELNQVLFDECISILNEIYNNKDEVVELQWLIDETEKFCQEKALYNAIIESVDIIGGKSKDKDKGSIPNILNDALAVTFDSNIGHDYLDNAENRYDFFHKKENKIPFDLEIFNKITKGGINNKTVTVILSKTGGGKSLFKCHMSASCLSQGKNVLYITCEMAEEKIAERIDANLLNITIDELYSLSKNEYLRKIENIRNFTKGKLVIKEYPTSSASVNHFRKLLQDLKLKKNFIPDIIFIDYLNICASARLKHGSNVNSYLYIKSIIEELRALAIEYDVPVVTSSQLTRNASQDSDPELDGVSESKATGDSADFMFAIVNTEELEKLNQVMIKLLKNRYNDLSYYKRFVVGLNKSKMRFYDVSDSAQMDIADSGQVHQEQKIQVPKKEIITGIKF